MPIKISDLHKADLPYSPEQIAQAFHAVFRNSPQGRVVYEVLLHDWVLHADGVIGTDAVDGLRHGLLYINAQLRHFDALTLTKG